MKTKEEVQKAIKVGKLFQHCGYLVARDKSKPRRVRERCKAEYRAYRSLVKRLRRKLARMTPHLAHVVSSFDNQKTYSVAQSRDETIRWLMTKGFEVHNGAFVKLRGHHGGIGNIYVNFVGDWVEFTRQL